MMHLEVMSKWLPSVYYLKKKKVFGVLVVFPPFPVFHIFLVKNVSLTDHCSKLLSRVQWTTVLNRVLASPCLKLNPRFLFYPQF